MKKIAGILVLGLVLFFSNMVLAENITGNKLLSNCTTVLNSLDNRSENFEQNGVKNLGFGFCLGVMNGITTLNKAYENRFEKNALFCLPNQGITNGQAVRIVVKYLKEHPELLHIDGTSLAIFAFIGAYPCK